MICKNLLAIVLLLSCGCGEKASSVSEGLFAEDIKYGEGDGQALLLDVYGPGHGAQEERAAIVLIHGGGWQQGSKAEMRGLASGLSREGYVCFAVDHRLVQGGKNTFPSQLYDVQRAVRWIRANGSLYGVSGDRVAALGASSGAHLAALLGTTEALVSDELSEYSSRVDCVVDISGPADLTIPFPDTVLDGLSIEDIVVQLIGASRDEDMDAYRLASPYFQIGFDASPFLIFHGTNDRLIPVAQSRNLHERLQDFGVTSVYVEFGDEGHEFTRPLNLETFSKTTLTFLKTHLRGSR